MGLKEDVLALADELGAFEDGDCEECGLYGQPECKGHLSCMEIMERYAARKMREAVERDGEGATTASAYDLLGDDDREALAWVREMGGIERCEELVHQSAMEHGCLLKVAEMLGTSIYDGTSNADALLDKLEKRLMPEDMEWPKVDGKPVDFKTAYGPSLGVLEAVSIYNTGACQVMSHDGIVKSAKDIHIVKPKVLDADGAEIRKGDVLYRKSDGRMVKVAEVYEKTFIDAEGYVRPGDGFTHRAPVLAADGKPIREGETVWHVGNGVEFTVIGLPNPGEYQSVKLRLDGGASTGLDPDLLTHQRPVLDADGVPIKKGDTVYVAPFDDPLTVRGFAADGRVLMDYHSDDSLGYRPERLTHAKPEPPDTYAKLYEDVHDERCSSDEFVRRCRALAERGEIRH